MGTVRVLSRIASLASKYDCSNSCSFRDMTFFVIFSKIFRKFKLFFFKSEFFNHVVGYRQSTIKKLQILPPSMTVQILVVFEI